MRSPYVRLHIHLVWSTWDRLPLITHESEPRLYGAIAEKAKKLNVQTVAMGGTDNHIHLLCVVPPSLCLSDLMRHLKGSSSHLMAQGILGNGTFRWQGAYGAFAVSPEAVPRVREYIQRQKEHHAKQDLWPEWERTTEPEAGDSGA